MIHEPNSFGTLDATFQAAGQEDGIRRLVDCFYDIMEENPDYQRIRSWHPRNSEISRDKLARFLCGWMGGPGRYQERYGPISIPQAHRHLQVTESEKDQWLSCMREALNRQDYPEPLIEYLYAQLSLPAEAIRRACSASD
ncbi:MAG: hypothetical protein DHS20C12_16810 [Pseudohongiella sp.]|nr:MAG: hypothetical protein DHS20C12_16810 [Pseudohongiella sp.]